MIAAYLRWMPDLAARRNPVRVAWDALQAAPGGPRLFLAAVRRSLPAPAPRGMRVSDLRPGFASVDVVSGRNGDDPVDAGADLAVITAHLAVCYALPDGARARVAERSWEAPRAARGGVTVTATLLDGGECGARWTAWVEARDATGERCGVGELCFQVERAAGA